ncbi:MAG: hypothetical protein ACM3NH_03315 [Candidatus Saccharibacteria bacterium]
MKKTLLGTVIFILLLAGVGWWAFSNSKPKVAVASYDEFAKCLQAKGVTMYGAAWCPHCQNEKKTFGTSFQYVPYVECPDNPQACSAKGVESYPTWIMPSGEKLVGEQDTNGFKDLAAKSSCPLPNK